MESGKFRISSIYRWVQFWQLFAIQQPVSQNKSIPIYRMIHAYVAILTFSETTEMVSSITSIGCLRYLVMLIARILCIIYCLMMVVSHLVASNPANTSLRIGIPYTVTITIFGAIFLIQIYGAFLLCPCA